jgi:mRNA interferase MazF
LLDEGEASLPKRSVVVVSQVCVFERTQFGERIGAVSDERVEQVLSGLRFQQKAFFRD